jgi:hypothetical protein
MSAQQHLDWRRRAFVKRRSMANTILMIRAIKVVGSIYLIGKIKVFYKRYLFVNTSPTFPATFFGVPGGAYTFFIKNL